MSIMLSRRMLPNSKYWCRLRGMQHCRSVWWLSVSWFQVSRLKQSMTSTLPERKVIKPYIVLLTKLVCNLVFSSSTTKLVYVVLYYFQALVQWSHILCLNWTYMCVFSCHVLCFDRQLKYLMSKHGGISVYHGRLSTLHVIIVHTACHGDLLIHHITSHAVWVASSVSSQSLGPKTLHACVGPLKPLADVIAWSGLYLRSILS